MMGGTVVIACRSEDRAMEAIRKMTKEYKELKQSGTEALMELEGLRVEYMHLDLSSFKSTKDFVENFNRSGRQLHVLVCNAGVSKAKFEKTDDGFESAFQINYLSHFLLIGQLLPVMKNSDGDDKRIILVSSVLHKWPRYDITQMNYSGDPEKYSTFGCYGRSKLYQIMQMHCLHRRLRNTNISVNSVYPGFVDTGMGRDFVERRAYKLFMGFCRFLGIIGTPFEGANSVLYAAVAPTLKSVSGIYLEDCQEGSTSVAARDKIKQEEVWKQTMEYLKEHFSEEEMISLEGEDSLDI